MKFVIIVTESFEVDVECPDDCTAFEYRRAEEQALHAFNMGEAHLMDSKLTDIYEVQE